MKIGFDNEKYLTMQSEHIKQRIGEFGDKLYLEFGGKLFDDYHASRVLPGFAPDSKLRMLLQMADLVLFDVSRIDGNEDFGLVSHLKEHTELAVRCKAGQDPGGVVVVKKLSSEFQIQLVSEFPNTLFDVF